MEENIYSKVAVGDDKIQKEKKMEKAAQLLSKLKMVTKDHQCCALYFEDSRKIVKQ